MRLQIATHHSSFFAFTALLILAPHEKAISSDVMPALSRCKCQLWFFSSLFIAKQIRFSAPDIRIQMFVYPHFRFFFRIHFIDRYYWFILKFRKPRATHLKRTLYSIRFFLFCLFTHQMKLFFSQFKLCNITRVEWNLHAPNDQKKNNKMLTFELSQIA